MAHDEVTALHAEWRLHYQLFWQTAEEYRAGRIPYREALAELSAIAHKGRRVMNKFASRARVTPAPPRRFQRAGE